MVLRPNKMVLPGIVPTIAELKLANPDFFFRVTLWRHGTRKGALFITKKRWTICWHGGVAPKYYLIHPGSLELERVFDVSVSDAPVYGQAYFFSGHGRTTLTVDLRKGVVIAGPLEVLATYVAAEEQRKAARIAIKQHYSSILP